MQDNFDFNNELNIDNIINSEGLHSYRDIPKIRVIVRKRPCNKKELMRNDIDIIETRGSQKCVVKELKNKVDLTKYIEEHHFSFDHVFDENATNEMIYLETVRPMIDAAFNKAKVTCFAYGQTGSGKTFTMMGNQTGKELQNPGLYILCAYDIFSYLEQERYNHLEIWVSFYEIYCGKLFDLLNERNVLQAREDGKQNICIVGLQEKAVTNLKTFMGIIDFGLKVRTTGVTGANMDSSRSHAILQIIIKESNGNPHGKISFIDLAGSERAVDTIDTNRQTKLDGAEINKSLLALKECIRALDQEKKHTPFRGSKLTLVLRDSFMGNCKTLMIANISPGLSCSEHTLNTLRYADRVKELRKDRNDKENFVNNNEKDPQELMAHLMMMPRQHTKTIKYNVDIKKNPNLQNFEKNNINNNNNNANQPRKTPIHINQLINNGKGKSTNLTNQNNNNYRPKTSNSQYTHSTKDTPNYPNRGVGIVATNSKFNSNKNNTCHSQLGCNCYNISPYVSRYNNQEITSDEDFQKLSHQHEKLINQILQEEEDFIGQHKGHIDDMVEIVKQEMGLINEVDKPGSDIEYYVGSLDKLLAEKVDKINGIRARLQNFNALLKDEEALSIKFNNNNDFLDVYDLNQKNTYDNDNDNLGDELEEELRGFEANLRK